MGSKQVRLGLSSRKPLTNSGICIRESELHACIPAGQLLWDPNKFCFQWNFGSFAESGEVIKENSKSEKLIAHRVKSPIFVQLSSFNETFFITAVD